MARKTKSTQNKSSQSKSMQSKSSHSKSAQSKSSHNPMNAISVIPKARANAQHVTALVKSSGRVTGYKLSNGKMLSKSDAVSLARRGGIAGVGISSRKGSEYLKSLPDGRVKNNLSNLPSVTG